MRSRLFAGHTSNKNIENFADFNTLDRKTCGLLLKEGYHG